MKTQINIIVGGIGTEVGKTVVSAILTTLIEGDYWKPIQCGQPFDSHVIKELVSPHTTIFPSAYSFKSALSPHHAARLENQHIDLNAIPFPISTKPLIIEMAGGVLSPLSRNMTSADLFKSWNCKWVLVSKHYLGSINHTLLTIEALKQRNIPLLGVIFNGNPNPDSESAILTISHLPCLGRVFPESQINLKIIQKYARKWKLL